MKEKVLLVAALTGAIALSACSKPADKPADAAAPAATADAAKPADAPAATNVADGVTGVKECDDYLNKVMACFNDKIPEAQRGAMKAALEQSKSQWAAVADKSALAAQCKSAAEQAKSAYAAFGCTL